MYFEIGTEVKVLFDKNKINEKVYEGIMVVRHSISQTGSYVVIYNDGEIRIYDEPRLVSLTQNIKDGGC